MIFRMLRLASRQSHGLSLATWERAAARPALLNLAIGQPALSLIPTAATQRAADLLTKEFDARHLLQYGSPSGSGRYLKAVADFLGDMGVSTVTPGTLFASPGNSGALSLIVRTLTRPEDVVLMEDPSYFLAHQVFRDNGVSLRPLPQHTLSGSSGTVDVDGLQGLLEQTPQAAPKPKLLYLVPTGNNPTGRSMPDKDRARLIALCAEHDIHVVADDVYETLQWLPENAPGPATQGAATSSPYPYPYPLRWHAQQQGVASTVISLGSWSKILGPGLRLGWIEAEAELLHALAADGEVESGSLTSPFVESLVTLMVESTEAQAHALALQAALRKRASLLARAIQDEQPLGTAPLVQPTSAGYFLWVSLRGSDAAALRHVCEASYGVSFLPGPRCTLDGGDGAKAAAGYGRVCFAFLEEDDLVEAGRRLGRAIAEAAA